MQDTKEQVREELINIFNGRSKSLPAWESLETIAEAAKENSENRKFAILVYYAIKDLLKPVGYNHREFIKKDDIKETLTMNEYFISAGDPGLTTVNERTIIPADWKPFKNINLGTLNKEQKDIPILKMNNYLIEINLSEGIAEWSNTKSIYKNIDRVFEPIIKKTSSRYLTFEQVIEQLNPKKIHTEPIPQVPDAIKPKETKKTKKELSFEDCFKEEKWVEMALEIIEQLDAVNKTTCDGTREYLHGIVLALKEDDEIIKNGLHFGNVYIAFLNKLGLRGVLNDRVFKPSEVYGSANLTAKDETKDLIRKYKKEDQKNQS